VFDIAVFDIAALEVAVLAAGGATGSTARW
jgi:hypothetical protein